MLTLNNISRSYPQRGMVLSKLELAVEKGDTLAVTGPSGSGKTTLLNILGLLDQSESGQYLLNGLDVTNLSQEDAAKERYKNIGFVFQDHMLLPYLSVLENIELPLLASQQKNKNSEMHKDHISDLMSRCGISDLSNKLPNQISGGEAQRATLVRALVNSPALLLADEPTGSLDTKNAENLVRLLIDLNREYKTTIITVTHSQSLAEEMGRVFELSDGALIRI